MEERDFYDERPEKKNATLNCPHCHQANEYEVSWLVRTKKKQLPGRADELPPDQPLVVYCAGGYRSAIAVSLLRGQGRAQVANLVGGLAAWESAQLDIAA